MSSHAKPFPRWLDTLASFLSWRVSAGRHTLRPLPDSAGATPEFGDQLHDWNSEPVTEEIPVVAWPVSAEAYEEIDAESRFERIHMDANDRGAEQ